MMVLKIRSHFGSSHFGALRPQPGVAPRLRRLYGLANPPFASAMETPDASALETPDGSGAAPLASAMETPDGAAMCIGDFAEAVASAMDLKKSDMLKTLVKLVEDDTQVIVNPDMVRLNSWQRLRGRCPPTQVTVNNGMLLVFLD